MQPDSAVSREGRQTGIFRAEVLRAQGQRASGHILLARPISSWIVVFVACVISAVIVLYLFLGMYTPRTTASGTLMPEGGVIRVSAPSPGVISERRVREGQSVKQGDVLFVLGDERRLLGQSASAKSPRVSELHSHNLAEKKRTLQRRLDTVEAMGMQSAQSLRTQHKGLSDELQRGEQEIELQRNRLQNAARAMERHRALARSGFMSELGLQDKEDQLDALNAQLLAMQRVRAQLLRSLAGNKDELDQLPLKTAALAAELDRDLATLAHELTDVEARDAFAITAPVSGMVTAINAEPGQAITTQVLATVIPEGAALVAHLFPTSKAFGFVELGQRVRLRFQAYPYQRFGLKAGTIVETSHSPLQADELSFMPSTTAHDAVFRVIVRLDAQEVTAHGRTIPLLPGMALEADIEQQPVRLIEWIFDPLLKVRRVL